MSKRGAGQIILTPVRIQRGDAVRAKLAALDLSDADIRNAVDWARADEPARQVAEEAHELPRAGAAQTCASQVQPRQMTLRNIAVKAPRVVLDTNVIVSALVFGSGVTSRCASFMGTRRLLAPGQYSDCARAGACARLSEIQTQRR